MNDEPTVWDLGELDEFFVWRDKNQGTLFLDVFRFSKRGQMTHRYSICDDKAKELLRQIAVHLVDGDTLELPPAGPTNLQ